MINRIQIRGKKSLDSALRAIENVAEFANGITLGLGRPLDYIFGDLNNVPTTPIESKGYVVGKGLFVATVAGMAVVGKLTYDILTKN